MAARTATTQEIHALDFEMAGQGVRASPDENRHYRKLPLAENDQGL
jgi:hypothetical protein